MLRVKFHKHRLCHIIDDKKSVNLPRFKVALRDYFTAYSRGWESQVTSAVKDLTGIEARGIAEFARDHAAAFGKR